MIKKNKITESPQIPLIEQILKNPEKAKGLSTNDALTLVHELDAVKEESESYKEEKKNTEERYRYDVRILNVLATSGLKGASIAHEMKNDRNSVSVNYDYIVSALKEYSIWDELNSPECTEYSYKNVPQLLNRNREITQKIVVFMNTMLDEIKKQKFTSYKLCVFNSISAIRANWIRDYASLNIIIDIDEAMCFDTSEDVFSAIFDNLILNSWQQNKSASKINISISIQKVDSYLKISYTDDGVGLPPKYINDPMRILAVHETSRENGHGLGMWIVNNTIQMTGGQIIRIDGHNGFHFCFELGDRL